jgi:uncharacterized membrane-anchored protein
MPRAVLLSLLVVASLWAPRLPAAETGPPPDAAPVPGDAGPDADFTEPNTDFTEPDTDLAGPDADFPDQADPAADADLDADEAALAAAVNESQVIGPASVALRDQATLRLPEGLIWVPEPAAARLMESMGNVVGDEFLGIIWSDDDTDNWFVTVDYTPSGYIEDGDARDWDIAELLDSLRTGTDAGNAFREQQGFAPIEVTGWVEEPRYDPARHHLVWSAGIKEKGVTATPDDGVNFNTYVLGRQGYIAMNLVTSAAQVQAQKPIVGRLLDSTAFNDGQRYADFDPATDAVAGYGLAALIGGAAAKKLGLLGVIAAFLAKSWKLVAVGAVAVAAAAGRFLGRGKQA